MKIITIIVTYNALRNDWLYKCLDSLLLSNHETDIVIVDNNSTDSTCDIIKKKYPKVHLIENKENKGFGKANNQGIEYGIKNYNDYFFLLNQDAWIEEDTLSKLISIAGKNHEYGIISPMHFNGKGDSLDYNFSNFIIPKLCNNLYSDYVTNSVKDEIYAVNFVNAAAWLLPKNTVKKIGGFSPTFFHYAEDDNYCQRVLYHNLKIGVYPYAKIFHDRQGRQNSMKSDATYRNRNAILLKYSNPFNNYYYSQVLKSNYKNIIKSIVTLRKIEIKNNYNELRFIQSRFKEIDKNNKQSQNTKYYNFLDTE